VLIGGFYNFSVTGFGSTNIYVPPNTNGTFFVGSLVVTNR
jgi:hypothetical protein